MKRILLSLIFFFPFFSIAQNDWLVFNTSNSGIPHNVVKDITIDATGNIWVATYGGIAKFNGADWTVYNTSNSTIPSNVCHSIKADENTIWIGSVYGLIKYDGINWTSYPYGYIISMEFEENGDKWFGGYETGLVKYDGTNWTRYDASNSDLIDSTIYSIAIDVDNNKWFATVDGLFKFDGTDWTLYNVANSDIAGNLVASVSVDVDNNKWVTVSDLGISRFDGVNWVGFDSVNSELPDNNINTEIDFDTAGTKWIGTSTAGLINFDDFSWNVYNTSNSGLPSNFILSVLIDANENKWIGTYGGGLAVYHENGIVLHNPDIEKKYIDIYPNPAQDFLYLKNSKDEMEYKILDNIGRTILSGKTEKVPIAIGINVQTLSPGFYRVVFPDLVNRSFIKL